MFSNHHSNNTDINIYKSETVIETVYQLLDVKKYSDCRKNIFLASRAPHPQTCDHVVSNGLSADTPRSVVDPSHWVCKWQTDQYLINNRDTDWLTLILGTYTFPSLHWPRTNLRYIARDDPQNIFLFIWFGIKEYGCAFDVCANKEGKAYQTLLKFIINLTKNKLEFWDVPTWFKFKNIWIWKYAD